MVFVRRQYHERLESFTFNPAAHCLLRIISSKKTNLCVSADVLNSSLLLRLAEAVGPFICLLKTHCDIIEDFSPSCVAALESIAKKHDFMIFEDRKFADIGNTARLQYEKGVHRIADWAHFTDAHALPGEQSVAALRSIGEPKGRGLFLLASMSSAGSLFDNSYVKKTVEIAERHYPQFVVGFIAQTRPSHDSKMDFLVLTPGIKILEKDSLTNDNFGQCYRTPAAAFSSEVAADIIIVGRAIYSPFNELNHPNPDAASASFAEDHRKAAWEAYLGSIKNI